LGCAQAFGALAYFFVDERAAFYAVAAVLGFIYAGVMPLYAVLARKNFPLRMMGTIIGGTAMAGGLGMAIGPVAGGFIYDTTGSYAWLYLGAWGMGGRRRFPDRDAVPAGREQGGIGAGAGVTPATGAIVCRASDCRRGQKKRSTSGSLP
jgi:hypothetical protein